MTSTTGDLATDVAAFVDGGKSDGYYLVILNARYGRDAVKAAVAQRDRIVAELTKPRPELFVNEDGI